MGPRRPRGTGTMRPCCTTRARATGEDATAPASSRGSWATTTRPAFSRACGATRTTPAAKPSTCRCRARAAGAAARNPRRAGQGNWPGPGGHTPVHERARPGCPFARFALARAVPAIGSAMWAHLSFALCALAAATTAPPIGSLSACRPMRARPRRRTPAGPVSTRRRHRTPAAPRSPRRPALEPSGGSNSPPAPSAPGSSRRTGSARSCSA